MPQPRRGQSIKEGHEPGGTHHRDKTNGGFVGVRESISSKTKYGLEH